MRILVDMSCTFLTAEWRKLIMAQYEVAPEVLRLHLPRGLEPDLYRGRCFVSLVGFLFDRVRILGVPRRGGGTAEYAVEHRSWEVYPVREHRIAADFGSLYGPAFAGLSARAPDHVLLAEGSPVNVRWGGRIA